MGKKISDKRKMSSLEKKKEEARKLLNVLMKLDDTSLLLVENSINLLASRDAIEQQKHADKNQEIREGGG